MVGNSFIGWMYLAESTLFHSRAILRHIYTSVSSATTQTTLDSSVDEAKTVYKVILGSVSLWFDYGSGASTTLLGVSTVEW